MTPVTREEAKSKGLKHYFTGKPCPHGHIAKRFVSTRACHECLLEKNARWAAANPDKKRCCKKRWDAENADHIREYNQRWCDANREWVRERGKPIVARYRAKPETKIIRQNEVHRRRARLLNAAGKVSARDLKEILAAQKCRCAACGCSIKARKHLDHIIPLAAGGRHERRNLQFLCPPCNMSKGARRPEEFMRAMGRLL